jgi:hypothetical protein
LEKVPADDAGSRNWLHHVIFQHLFPATSVFGVVTECTNASVEVTVADELSKMSLVTYSDSEGSDAEQPPTKTTAPPTKPSTGLSNSNFEVNKANPRKIQVKLQDIPRNGETDGEPAPKRPRIGGGAFSGFNAMLPAPKRDSDAKAVTKPAARRVFSLKTGAEPGFSRESDAELRHLFAEQETDSDQQLKREASNEDHITPSKLAGDSSTQPPVKGSAFIFKPLSVARGNKKPKRKNDISSAAASKKMDGSAAPLPSSTKSTTLEHSNAAPPPKKLSLFGVSNEPEPDMEPQPQEVEDDAFEAPEKLAMEEDSFAYVEASAAAPENESTQAQSLDFIASDLNLSKADRRQLFGRRGHAGGTAINVVNFNTDQEYAANEALRASGEQVQHNPVRSIAPGKHSLKQLVSAATGQKDALEESFATGRKNKKEAGSKYGW